jgi:hypothetical protein
VSIFNTKTPAPDDMQQRGQLWRDSRFAQNQHSLALGRGVQSGMVACEGCPLSNLDQGVGAVGGDHVLN